MEASSLFHIQLCGWIFFVQRQAEHPGDIKSNKKYHTPHRTPKTPLYENAVLQGIAFNY